MVLAAEPLEVLVEAWTELLEARDDAFDPGYDVEFAEDVTGARSSDRDINSLAAIDYAMRAGLPVVAWKPASRNDGVQDRVDRAARQFSLAAKMLMTQYASGSIDPEAFASGMSAAYLRQARNAFLAGKRGLGNMQPLTASDEQEIRRTLASAGLDRSLPPTPGTIGNYMATVLRYPQAAKPGEPLGDMLARYMTGMVRRVAMAGFERAAKERQAAMARLVDEAAAGYTAAQRGLAAVTGTDDPKAAGAWAARVSRARTAQERATKRALIARSDEDARRDSMRAQIDTLIGRSTKRIRDRLRVLRDRLLDGRTEASAVAAAVVAVMAEESRKAYMAGRRRAGVTEPMDAEDEEDLESEEDDESESFVGTLPAPQAGMGMGALLAALILDPLNLVDPDTLRYLDRKLSATAGDFHRLRMAGERAAWRMGLRDAPAVGPLEVPPTSALASMIVPPAESIPTTPVGRAVMVWWQLGAADACPDCVRFAEGSPYWLDQFDAMGISPGSGHTRCGNRCRCSLDFDRPSTVCMDAALIESEYTGGPIEYVWVQEADSCRHPIPIDSLKPDPIDYVDDVPEDQAAFDWDTDVAQQITTPMDETSILPVKMMWLTNAPPGQPPYIPPTATIRVRSYALGDTTLTAVYTETDEAIRFLSAMVTSGDHVFEPEMILAATRWGAAEAAAKGKQLQFDMRLVDNGFAQWLKTLGFSPHTPTTFRVHSSLLVRLSDGQYVPASMPPPPPKSEWLPKSWKPGPAANNPPKTPFDGDTFKVYEGMPTDPIQVPGAPDMNSPLVPWSGVVPDEPALPAGIMLDADRKAAMDAANAAWKTPQDIVDRKVRWIVSNSAKDDVAAKKLGLVPTGQLGDKRYYIAATQQDADALRAAIKSGMDTSSDDFWQAWLGYSKQDLDIIDAGYIAGKTKSLRAGVVIVEPDGRYVFLAPRNQFAGYENTWSKGGLDPGETAAQAAVREAREELGLSVELDSYLGDYTSSDGGSMSRYYIAHRTGGGPALAKVKETYALRIGTYEETRPVMLRYGKQDKRDTQILDDAHAKLTGRSAITPSGPTFSEKWSYDPDVANALSATATKTTSSGWSIQGKGAHGDNWEITWNLTSSQDIKVLENVLVKGIPNESFNTLFAAVLLHTTGQVFDGDTLRISFAGLPTTMAQMVQGAGMVIPGAKQTMFGWTFDWDQTAQLDTILSDGKVTGAATTVVGTSPSGAAAIQAILSPPDPHAPGPMVQPSTQAFNQSTAQSPTPGFAAAHGIDKDYMDNLSVDQVGPISGSDAKLWRAVDPHDTATTGIFSIRTDDVTTATLMLVLPTGTYHKVVVSGSMPHPMEKALRALRQVMVDPDQLGKDIGVELAFVNIPGFADLMTEIGAKSGTTAWIITPDMRAKLIASIDNDVSLSPVPGMTTTSGNPAGLAQVQAPGMGHVSPAQPAPAAAAPAMAAAQTTPMSSQLSLDPHQMYAALTDPMDVEKVTTKLYVAHWNGWDIYFRFTPSGNVDIAVIELQSAMGLTPQVPYDLAVMRSVVLAQGYMVTPQPPFAEHLAMHFADQVIDDASYGVGNFLAAWGMKPGKVGGSVLGRKKTLDLVDAWTKDLAPVPTWSTPAVVAPPGLATVPGGFQLGGFVYTDIPQALDQYKKSLLTYDEYSAIVKGLGGIPPASPGAMSLKMGYVQTLPEEVATPGVGANALVSKWTLKNGSTGYLQVSGPTWTFDWGSLSSFGGAQDKSAAMNAILHAAWMSGGFNVELAVHNDVIAWLGKDLEDMLQVAGATFDLNKNSWVLLSSDAKHLGQAWIDDVMPSPKLPPPMATTPILPSHDSLMVSSDVTFLKSSAGAYDPSTPGAMTPGGQFAMKPTPDGTVVTAFASGVGVGLDTPSNVIAMLAVAPPGPVIFEGTSITNSPLGDLLSLHGAAIIQSTKYPDGALLIPDSMVSFAKQQFPTPPLWSTTPTGMTIPAPPPSVVPTPSAGLAFPLAYDQDVAHTFTHTDMKSKTWVGINGNADMVVTTYYSPTGGAGTVSWRRYGNDIQIWDINGTTDMAVAHFRRMAAMFEDNPKLARIIDKTSADPTMAAVLAKYGDGTGKIQPAQVKAMGVDIYNDSLIPTTPPAPVYAMTLPPDVYDPDAIMKAVPTAKTKLPMSQLPAHVYKNGGDLHEWHYGNLIVTWRRAGNRVEVWDLIDVDPMGSSPKAKMTAALAHLQYMANDVLANTKLEGIFVRGTILDVIPGNVLPDALVGYGATVSKNGMVVMKPPAVKSFSDVMVSDILASQGTPMPGGLVPTSAAAPPLGVPPTSVVILPGNKPMVPDVIPILNAVPPAPSKVHPGMTEIHIKTDQGSLFKVAYDDQQAIVDSFIVPGESDANVVLASLMAVHPGDAITINGLKTSSQIDWATQAGLSLSPTGGYTGLVPTYWKSTYGNPPTLKVLGPGGAAVPSASQAVPDMTVTVPNMQAQIATQGVPIPGTLITVSDPAGHGTIQIGVSQDYITVGLPNTTSELENTAAIIAAATSIPNKAVYVLTTPQPNFPSTWLQAMGVPSKSPGGASAWLLGSNNVATLLGGFPPPKPAAASIVPIPLGKTMTKMVNGQPKTMAGSWSSKQELGWALKAHGLSPVSPYAPKTAIKGTVWNQMDKVYSRVHETAAGEYVAASLGQAAYAAKTQAIGTGKTLIVSTGSWNTPAEEKDALKQILTAFGFTQSGTSAEWLEIGPTGAQDFVDAVLKTAEGPGGVEMPEEPPPPPRPAPARPA